MPAKPVTQKRAAKPVAKPGKKATVKSQAKEASQLGKIESLVVGLNYDELDALIKAATAKRDEQMAGERASFFDEVKARASRLGVSLMDLVGQGSKPVNSPKAKSKPTVKAARPVKYRNPETGEESTGVGRPARWLIEAEKAGRKREEFAV
jgi:DNA-binding protein H-NS